MDLNEELILGHAAKRRVIKIFKLQPIRLEPIAVLGITQELD